MRDLPIPFSAPMVLAMLADRKLETRRVAGSKDGAARLMCRSCCCNEREWKDGYHDFGSCTGTLEWTPVKKISQRVGDRLYVREEIEAWRSGPYKYVRYSADQHNTFREWPEEWQRDKARPMHMFKRFSRMTLPVTGVRVEQLHDITESGAIAEGIQSMDRFSLPVNDPSFAVAEHDSNGWFPTAVAAYEALWDSINGAGAWDANPWVTVTSWSHVIHKNIDHVQP